MNNTKKMFLVPYQDGGNEGNADVFKEAATPEAPETPVATTKRGNSIRKYAADRQAKLLQIVLKVAEYGGYDSDGRIRTKNGEQADIIPLLLHSASPGRNITGLPDFVDLLYRAGVTPDMIINKAVKQDLADRIKMSGAPAPRKRMRTSIPGIGDQPSRGLERKADNIDPASVPLPDDKSDTWDVDNSDEEGSNG